MGWHPRVQAQGRALWGLPEERLSTHLGEALKVPEEQLHLFKRDSTQPVPVAVSPQWSQAHILTQIGPRGKSEFESQHSRQIFPGLSLAGPI